MQTETTTPNTPNTNTVNLEKLLEARFTEMAAALEQALEQAHATVPTHAKVEAVKREKKGAPKARSLKTKAVAIRPVESKYVPKGADKETKVVLSKYVDDSPALAVWAQSLADSGLSPEAQRAAIAEFQATIMAGRKVGLSEGIFEPEEPAFSVDMKTVAITAGLTVAAVAGGIMAYNYLKD